MSTDADAVEAVVTFWRHAIDHGPPGELTGFGWMAVVDAIDDQLWADLTWQCQQLVGGPGEWPDAVAQRASRLTPTTTTLAILDQLVRFETEPSSRYMLAPLARTHIEAAGVLAGSVEFIRLRSALQERGWL
jgi:hypothetical protein